LVANLLSAATLENTSLHTSSFFLKKKEKDKAFILVVGSEICDILYAEKMVNQINERKQWLNI
jgi:hypothetical protein